MSKTFICSKKNNKFKLESFEEDFEIGPKTIIINETKISISKEQDESKDLLTKNYNRSLLDKTLLFSLNKLIRKIEYYSVLVKNEFKSNKN